MDRRDPDTGQFVSIDEPPEKRFWASVTTRGPDECWEWQAGKTGKGYGAFYPIVPPGQVGAHVWAWESVNGPVPDGKVIDHLCGNRGCVNPSHLEPCGRGENVLRSANSNAGRNMRKTECDRGHPLSGDNLIVRRNYRNPSRPPWRQCRICANRRKRERRALRGDHS